MWGGHSCPPLLIFLRHQVRSLGKSKDQVKSGGQECPPHMDYSAFRVFPSIAFFLPVGA
jgi:hypothetical protein